MPFRLFFLILFGVVLLPLANSHAGNDVRIAWDFLKASPSSENGSIELRVNGKSFPVSKNPNTVYQALEPSDFPGYHIPKNALLAAYSWYAGYGDVVYVIQKSNTLEVYRREMDESESSRAPDKKVLTIRLE